MVDADILPPPSRCRLLGPQAIVVQAMMGIVVLLSLVYKRHRERPMRPWKIWLFDVGKQLAGQAVVHMFNIGISSVVSTPSSVGVGIIWAVHHGLTNLLTEKFELKGFRSGSYGRPLSLMYWVKQTGVYIVAIMAMKFVLIILLALFPSIFRVGDWLLSWTGSHESIQVIFVLGVYPIFMNILQFWLIDSIVKASALLLSEDAEQPVVRDEEEQDRRLLDDHESDIDELDSESRYPSSPRTTVPDHLASTHSNDSTIRPGSYTSGWPNSGLHSPRPKPSSQINTTSPTNWVRSPPPSPSPAVTPTSTEGYGATSDSPRLRPSDLEAISGWEWKDAGPPASQPLPARTSRKESWTLPRIGSNDGSPR